MISNRPFRIVSIRPRRDGQSIADSLAVVAALAFGMIVALVAPRAGVADSQVASNINVKPGTPDQPITFRDRLVVGLKAVSKSDVAFVDSVVAKVQTGKLSQRLVDQTFVWARERAKRPSIGREHRPIIYFQPAMTAQAKALGVAL